MIWVLKNWRLIAIGLLMLGIAGNFLYIKHLRHENQSLTAKLETVTANYEQLKKVREGERLASSEYQASSAALRSELNRVKRMRSTCIVPLPPPATGSGGNTGRKLLGRNGISSEFLYDFAARCEDTRLKALGCKKICG